MITKKRSTSFLALLLGLAFICSSVVWSTAAPFPSPQMQPSDPRHDQNQKTWTGTVKKDDSGKLVLVTSDGKIFKLTPEEQVASMVEKSVKITGTLKGDVITVTSVEPME